MTVTAVAGIVGARTAGLLASFPIFGTILALFAHRMRGAETARQVLRGMVFALYGFATFFMIFGITVTTFSLETTFAFSTAGCLLVQSIALYLVRRQRGEGAQSAAAR
ncbi:hypothetical protein [Rhizobium phaseoli]|uniref:hypothetical protein n=1 Tax=Rhizobium phaseoli TaxID=396 RepID=UPI0012372403|nr:hypothetical protein [Rhizobium phaseoli]